MFYDDIIRAGISLQQPAALIKIDNVAQYVNTLPPEKQRQQAGAEAVRNIKFVPPFSVSWFEYKVPKAIHPEKTSPFTRCGCMVYRFDKNEVMTNVDKFLEAFHSQVLPEHFHDTEMNNIDAEEEEQFFKDRLSCFKSGVINNEKTCFIAAYRWYVEFLNKPYFLECYAIALDKSGHLDFGEIQPNEEYRQCIATFASESFSPLNVAITRYQEQGGTDALYNLYYSDFHDATLNMASGLMHCKNVTTTPVQFSPKLIKARQKRNKPFFDKYYTLQIEPMKKAIAQEQSAANTTGIKQALHICRGHFKNYEESGLFGKLKGIYWWNDQARGNATTGKIRKDYNIITPLRPET